jgi:hypothetical protein
MTSLDSTCSQLIAKFDSYMSKNIFVNPKFKSKVLVKKYHSRWINSHLLVRKVNELTFIEIL